MCGYFSHTLNLSKCKFNSSLALPHFKVFHQHLYGWRPHLWNSKKKLVPILLESSVQHFPDLNNYLMSTPHARSALYTRVVSVCPSV